LSKAYSHVKDVIDVIGNIRENSVGIWVWKIFWKCFR
jgi:hypothetical protein